MAKVADKGIKIDLHIHSFFSNKKDGDKVKNNTLENLPVLVKNLLEQEVELCAITDHDTFNYEIYKTLKEEEKKENCIKKVLPGIEFSVEFSEGTVIHIVTIFDDKDDEKVKNIERVMVEGAGKKKYKKTKECFERIGYFDVLNEIGLDFIMIAHQKKTVTSQQKAQANDVMSLGKDTFNELVFMDYFDAYEFRNKKNEIYNKVYIAENNLSDNLRFITGSDCHDWSCYPKMKEGETSEFTFTYVKALPTFKGIAMAITDSSRISLTNRFFNPTEEYVRELEIQIGEEELQIPLSKGINVIIGDNSVGKSLFLNAITNYNKVPQTRIKEGYRKYLAKHKISIKTIIPDGKVFMHNSQGEIRDIFDKEGMKPNEYLKQFYPEKINVAKYREPVERELDRLFQCIDRKFEYDRLVKNLPTYNIFVDDISEKCLTFINSAKKINVNELNNLVREINEGINALNIISESKVIETDDKKHIDSSVQLLEVLREKYERRLTRDNIENVKINCYTTYIGKYKSQYYQRITDGQVIYSDFVEKKNDTIQGISEVILKKWEMNKFEANISDVKVVPETNPVDRFRFISKLEIEKINNEYINSIIQSVLKKGMEIDTSIITEEYLQNALKNFSMDDEVTPLDFFKQKIRTRVGKDFNVRNTIVDDNMDVYDELSSGFDAQTYFSLICGETRDKGIYIIDQPEDHISQKAIKENVLGQFKRMGENRQVIMVTHNPQFIVNLDVDNVIFLTVENGKFCVKSGALEYENDDYSVLNIIAENIEGGLKTILGRMKRYEKNI